VAEETCRRQGDFLGSAFAGTGDGMASLPRFRHPHRPAGCILLQGLRTEQTQRGCNQSKEQDRAQSFSGPSSSVTKAKFDSGSFLTSSGAESRFCASTASTNLHDCHAVNTPQRDKQIGVVIYLVIKSSNQAWAVVSCCAGTGAPITIAPTLVCRAPEGLVREATKLPSLGSKIWS
jgi:hypothetical protein